VFIRQELLESVGFLYEGVATSTDHGANRSVPVSSLRSGMMRGILVSDILSRLNMLFLTNRINHCRQSICGSINIR
jgi:hypothetical protein